MSCFCSPNRSDRWGGSPLDDAQRHRFPSVADALRERGGRLGVRDHGAALIEAAYNNDADTVKALLASGAAVTAADYDKRSALHLASSEGHVQVVSTLLLAKADVNCADRWGGRPLDDAKRKGHSQCVDLLKEHGAMPSDDDALPLSHRAGGEAAASDAAAAAADGLLVDWDDLTVLEKIGQGAFGEIVKCRWRGTVVAAKMIKSGESLRGGALFGGGGSTAGGSPTQMRTEAVNDFKHEIAFLAKLRHPNICLLLGFSLAPQHEVMISELMKCSLLDVLKTHAAGGTPFSLERTCRYSIQFAQGMNFLHTHKPPILHRDLKPANLLLDFSDTLKVSDFGLAKVRPTPATKTSTTPSKAAAPEDEYYQPYIMTGETGSYRFMAPEVFRHEAYGRPVDVYSFAMILFNMLDGQAPWPDLDGMRAVTLAALENARPAVPRHWDAKLAELLRASWHEEPRTRPSFAAVLETLNEFHLSQFKCTVEEMVKRSGGGPADSGCCSVM